MDFVIYRFFLQKKSQECLSFYLISYAGISLYRIKIHIRHASKKDARYIAKIHVEAWRSDFKKTMPDEYLKSLFIGEWLSRAWPAPIPPGLATKSRFFEDKCLLLARPAGSRYL